MKFDIMSGSPSLLEFPLFFPIFTLTTFAQY